MLSSTIRQSSLRGHGVGAGGGEVDKVWKSSGHPSQRAPAESLIVGGRRDAKLEAPLQFPFPVPDLH